MEMTVACALCGLRNGCVTVGYESDRVATLNKAISAKVHCFDSPWQIYNQS